MKFYNELFYLLKYNQLMKVDKFSLPAKIIWYIVFGIGYLILYMDYFSPNEWGKKRNVAVTSRKLNYKHVWGPITAVTIYFIIYAFLVSSAP